MSARGGAHGPRADRPWNHGYMVDTPYTDQMVPDLCPAWLSTISVLNGQPPLDPGLPLTWLDLGVGNGLSACVVAAANPNVEVWGYDFNPAHVERARSLVDRAGLDNCHIGEASFADLAADPALGPTDVDVIVVNGVYSWVSEANQAHIVDIIGRRLRPGGLAHVMYETPTGWSALMPYIEAVRLHARATSRLGHLAFPEAAAAVTALARRDDGTIDLPPREAAQMESWATADPYYAAHEYLGDHMKPIMFDQVVEALDAAQCSWIGGIEIVDHLPDYWVPPEFSEVIGSTRDVVVREMLRDVVTERQLRRDVFRRGLAAPLPLQQQAWLGDLRFVGLGRPFVEDPIPVLGGSIVLDPRFHAPLVDALASGPLSVDAVRAIHPEWGWPDAVVALTLQVAAGYAAPAVPGGVDPEVFAAARRLNEVLVAENHLGASHGYVVTPATGSAVVCDPFETLVFGAVWDGAAPEVGPLADMVLAGLVRQGRTVRHEGRLIDEPGEARRIVEERVRNALGRMVGSLTGLGAC